MAVWQVSFDASGHRGDLSAKLGAENAAKLGAENTAKLGAENTAKLGAENATSKRARIRVPKNGQLMNDCTRHFRRSLQPNWEVAGTQPFLGTLQTVPQNIRFLLVFKNDEFVA